MSELRDHLDGARQQHRAARYRGDLAAELLPQDNHGRGPLVGAMFRMGLVGAAIAAVVLLVVRFSHVPVQIESAPRQLVEITDDQPTAFAFGSFPVLSVPPPPDGLWAAPETPAFALSIPNFPDWNVEDSHDPTSTTQEAT